MQGELEEVGGVSRRGEPQRASLQEMVKKDNLFQTSLPMFSLIQKERTSKSCMYLSNRPLCTHTHTDIYIYIFTYIYIYVYKQSHSWKER